MIKAFFETFSSYIRIILYKKKCMIEKYHKDPNLKGVYVKRCKCGARPYLDRISISPTPWWIACNCGRTGKSDTDKKEAINNWNQDNLDW
jgi:hypothetical protein